MSSKIDDRGSKHLSPFRRVLRIVSMLFYVSLATGFVWLGVTRWNGVPTDSDAISMTGLSPGPPIDSEWDRTEELVAALGTVPALPALNLPPAPEGMEWVASSGATIELSDALAGEWTPQTRPNLKGVIDYLESPAVQSATKRLAAIDPGGWRPYRVGVGSMRSVRQATKLLVARARYHHASPGDIDGALADLEASYRVSAITYDSGILIGTLVALACEGLANSELQKLAREKALTRPQAARIIGSINDILPDQRTIWELAVSGEFDALIRTLDAVYTDDGQGDGWLALNYVDNVVDFTRSPIPRSGAWNVLSPLFNSRRIVAEKIDTLRRGYEAAGRMGYADALHAIKRAEDGVRFNMVDGPFCRISQRSSYARTYPRMIGDVARRHGAIVSVALSAYRHDHGEYPATLEEVVSDSAIALPLDPFVDQPLRYMRKGKNDYVLYSVGTNLTDDGGKKGTTGPKTGRSKRDGDLILTRPRGEPYMEPTLQKVRS